MINSLIDGKHGHNRNIFEDDRGLSNKNITHHQTNVSIGDPRVEMVDMETQNYSILRSLNRENN
jgi:hypothetical protein